ncbi:helix-turn-helix transcriptional regulator [Leuconostoc sp. MS02]|uniref:Helix-turn-helix transcriptional regulator n=1 Tax=Leuconostoc aquikimchii TaxID=3236804 RepID=A0ABV3S3I1_9LACO
MDNLILLAQLSEGTVFLLESSNHTCYYNDNVNNIQKITINTIINQITSLPIKNLYEMFTFDSGFVLRIQAPNQKTILFIVFQQQNLNSYNLVTTLTNILSDKLILCQSLYAIYTQKCAPKKEILLRELDTDFETNQNKVNESEELNNISKISTHLMSAINSSNEATFKIMLKRFINLPTCCSRFSTISKTRSEKDILISYIAILHRNIITHDYPTQLALELQSKLVKKIELTSHFTHFNKIIADIAWLYFTEVKIYNLKHNLSAADKIKNYIDKHLKEKLTLRKIAFSLVIPVNNLNPAFKEKYHESIKSYIINQKIETATQLLLHTDLSISEIAEELSFASVSHFTSSFKHIKNITPNHYRLEH